jgi:hypothetical protein
MSPVCDAEAGLGGPTPSQGGQPEKPTWKGAKNTAKIVPGGARDDDLAMPCAIPNDNRVAFSWTRSPAVARDLAAVPVNAPLLLRPVR